MILASPLITDSVVQAAHWLQAGQLLAYPTESVWGIGCDPFNEVAVQQLLSIKQRPVAKGMIVVTDSINRIEPLLAALNDEQRASVLTRWQPPTQQRARQAQTWLLPIDKSLNTVIPTWITGAHNSVAVRVIAHPLIQQLCAQVVTTDNPYGFIVSTSCNPSGHPPATTLQQAQAYFLDKNLNNSVGRDVNTSVIDDAPRQIGYLLGDTLGYELPSQINDALSGQIVR